MNRETHEYPRMDDDRGQSLPQFDPPEPPEPEDPPVDWSGWAEEIDRHELATKGVRNAKDKP